MPSTWTTTLPAGSTRIRMEPNILQDRWINIEQGEVPSDKWQLQRQAGNPTSIANSGLIFTKDAGGGVSELYYEDDNGTPKIIQMTTNGGIGAPSQAVNGSTYISLQSDNVTTFTNTQDGFCSASGRVASDGTQQAGYKISATSKLSTGRYRITFSPAMRTAEGYAILITPRDLSNTSDRFTWNVITQDANKFEVQFRDASGTVDVGFMFAVFMSRI